MIVLEQFGRRAPGSTYVSRRGLPWTDLRPGGDGFAGFPVPRDLGMYLPRCVADKPK